MMKSVTHFWRSIGFCLTLYAIYGLPKNIEDGGEEALAWQRWLAMFDQDTALWIFAFCALAYILWIDVRPLLMNSKKKSRIREETEHKLVSHSPEVMFDGSINKITKFAPQIPLKNVSDKPLTIKIRCANYSFFEKEHNMENCDAFTLQPFEETNYNFEVLEIDNKDILEGAGYLSFEIDYGRDDFLPNTLIRAVEMQFVKENSQKFRINSRYVNPKSLPSFLR